MAVVRYLTSNSTTPVQLLDTAPVEEKLDYWKKSLDWIADYGAD
jgi:hypothetical protein